MWPYIVGLLSLAVLFRWRFKSKQSLSSVNSGRTGCGIRMSNEDTAEERRYNEQVIGLLESRMIVCGHVKPEMLPKPMDVLRSGNLPFERLNSRIAFGGEPYLTLEEKRSLGLNTRRKYSREYIANFHQGSLGKIDPYDLLVNSHLAAFHEVSRHRDLEKFRRMGFVEKVRLRPYHECGQANTLRKVYPLGSTLDLPVAMCREPFCRCNWEVVVPDD